MENMDLINDIETKTNTLLEQLDLLEKEKQSILEKSKKSNQTDMKAIQLKIQESEKKYQDVLKEMNNLNKRLDKIIKSKK